MQRLELEILNMKCDGCYQKIMKLFKKNKYVKLIDKDFNSKKIILDYDPQNISILEIKNLLATIGY